MLRRAAGRLLASRRRVASTAAIAATLCYVQSLAVAISGSSMLPTLNDQGDVVMLAPLVRRSAGRAGGGARRARFLLVVGRAQFV